MKGHHYVQFGRFAVLAAIILMLWLNDKPYSNTVIVSFALALGGYFATYGAEYAARSKDAKNDGPAPAPPAKPPNDYDVELFQKIEKHLPLETYMKAVNEWDFRNSFGSTWLVPIWSFCEEWGTQQFVDPELETCRIRFWGAADHFSTLSAKYCGPTAPNRLSVQLERKDEDSQPDWVWKNGDELNQATSIMMDHFRLLVRAGRERIPKAPPVKPPIPWGKILDTMEKDGKR